MRPIGWVSVLYAVSLFAHMALAHRGGAGRSVIASFIHRKKDKDEVKQEIKLVQPSLPDEEELLATGEVTPFEVKDVMKAFDRFAWRQKYHPRKINKGAHTGYYLDLPPKPLQVFEWGPISREQWRQNREKYSYQYVCVMDQESGGVWYQRKAPRYWSDEHPPFHVRIIRPNWAGMALEAMGKGKARIRLVQKDVQTPAGQQKKAYVYEIVPR